MTVYIYQRSDWPRFRWDRDGLSATLAGVRHRQGRFIGRMEGLGFRLREEAFLGTLTWGKLTSSKWAKLTKCSQDTANRDVNDLLNRNVLTRDTAGGRSTSYSLVEPVDSSLGGAFILSSDR
jgi:Fic family protein